MNRIRVLVVDDHPLMREGLCARLGAEADIEVIGEADSAEAALAAVARRRPDVVLTDIGMRGMHGIDLARTLLQDPDAPRVLMLTMFDRAEYVQRALAAGASGYVVKDAPSAEIVEAIRTVAAGGSHVSASVATPAAPAAAGRGQLTDREQEVLELLGDGLSSKAIARRLAVGVRTVESHRHNIRRKLGLEGQAELIRHAVENRRTAGAG